jgi:hypothetical protein
MLFITPPLFVIKDSCEYLIHDDTLGYKFHIVSMYVK